jgi:protease-4
MTDQDTPKSPEQGTTDTPATNDAKDVWTSGPEIPREPKSTKPAEDGRMDESWQRDVINRLAFAALNEQRRARRWSVFFKSLLFVYLFILLFYVPSDWDASRLSAGKHTALVELDGVIASDSPANADNLVGGLRAAFEDKNTAGVILRINSPGGSPVQAGYVYDEIKRLRQEYPDIKLYAVITDMCASGGYYIASAADEIYADKASIVGSIGVLMDGFGFVDAMKKVGVERRLMTAGEHKGILDPFSPLKPEETKHVQDLLDDIHQQFIQVVKEGRGDRLSDSPQLFSGLFWSGEEGVKLGLVDGLGSSGYVAREIIGEEDIVDYTPRLHFLDRFADRIGATMANVLAAGLGMQQASLR